jgi:hypothetical protein
MTSNEMRDGRTVKYADASFRTNAWELALRDLTDSEVDAIQSLFDGVEGRIGTFTFVDPTANLLADSEELYKASWVKGPLLQIAAGIDDPVGGQRAVRLTNASQTTQEFSQSIASPAWFRYTFSVYARSTSETTVMLARSASSSTHSRVYQVGMGWTRLVLSGALSSTDTDVQFAVQMPAGVTVDFYGLQVEAQPCASAYKRTGAQNGVYENARFDEDVLRLISDGPDQHRFNLRIVARD